MTLKMDSGGIKLVLLIGLSTMSFASSEELKCEFSSYTWFYFNRRLWSCDVNNQAITEPGSTIAPFNTQTSVQALNIRDNPQIKFIPVNLEQKLPDLIAVKISNCSVKSVEDHHLQGLHKLIYLHLGRNKIESISSDAFKDNTKLESLALGHNKIQFINDQIFSQLEHIKLLYLHDNQIRFIDPLAFQNLRIIENINLDRNNITLLDPKSLENLVNLKDFSVSFNQLESIEVNLLRNCKNLEYIWFNGNKLKSIDAVAFDGLKNFIYVNLQSNICVDRTFWSNDLPELKTSLKSKCKSELQTMRTEIEGKLSMEKSSAASQISSLNSSLIEMTKENLKLAREVETMRSECNTEKTLFTSKISELSREVEELKDWKKVMRKTIYGE